MAEDLSCYFLYVRFGHFAGFIIIIIKEVKQVNVSSVSSIITTTATITAIFIFTFTKPVTAIKLISSTIVIIDSFTIIVIIV